MSHQPEMLETFIGRLEQYGPKEDINTTRLDNVIVIRESQSHTNVRTIYEPFLAFVGKGQKYCYVGKQKYAYGAGSGLAVLLPMPVRTEIVGATAEHPFLAAIVALDLNRLSDILIKIERSGGFAAQPTAEDASGIFSIALTDDLLRPILRLFEALESEQETAVLSGSIIDEIHYRLLCHEHGSALRSLLRQRGQIQRISRAIDHIHQHVDKPVSVEQLAAMVHMSRTTFHEHFRSVMHVSPLQYAKSVKLFQANRFIIDGKNASEAGYLVGYNSPAQFSREYKRHFGYSPSATTAAVV